MGSCQYGSLRCLSWPSLRACAYIQQFPPFLSGLRPTVQGAADTTESAFPICCHPEVGGGSKVRAPNARNSDAKSRRVSNLAARARLAGLQHRLLVAIITLTRF